MVSTVPPSYSSHNQSSTLVGAHLSGSVMLCADATGWGTMTSVLAELESRVTGGQMGDISDYKSYMTVGNPTSNLVKYTH